MSHFIIPLLTLYKRKANNWTLLHWILLCHIFLGWKISPVKKERTIPNIGDRVERVNKLKWLVKSFFYIRGFLLNFFFIKIQWESTEFLINRSLKTKFWWWIIMDFCYVIQKVLKNLNNRATMNFLPVSFTYLGELCFSVLTSIKTKTKNTIFCFNNK